MNAFIELYPLQMSMDPALYTALLFASGALSGFSSGLLGLGGCYINVPAQYGVLTSTGMGDTLAVRIAFGSSLAAALVIASLGTVEHHQRGEVMWEAAVPMGIAGIFGSLTGGTIASYTQGPILRYLFATVLLLAAVRMVVPLKESRGAAGFTVAHWMIAGFGFGIVSGFVGIAGGIVILPVLVGLLGFPIRLAAGTSSACILFTSAGGSLAYIINGLGKTGLPPLSLGYLNLFHWACLTATAVPFTILGIRMEMRVSERTLMVVFACLLALISLYMFGIFS
jgi:uncharacterized membrane protein YfcA